MHDLIKNFINLKRAFVAKFGEENLWNYGDFNNCIEYWSSKFEDYFDMFSTLLITEHNDYVLLRYNLMETDAQFWQAYNGMYRECRSIVIDKKNECFALTPFRKFFNLNETDETSEKVIRDKIANAKRVEISDKMDGSMQSARYYNGEYLLAGTRALNPEQSFRVSIGYSLLTDNYKQMLRDYPDCTFIFELICKEDAHVVAYTSEQRGLYLLGIRNSINGETMSYADTIQIAESYGVKHTKVFNKTFDDVLKERDDKRSDEAEGFVVDIDGYKIKIKYNDYLAIHKMLSKLISTNTIIRCIDNGTWDDVRSRIPEAYHYDADIIANDVKSFNKLMDIKLKKMYTMAKSKYIRSDVPREDRKNFAIHVLNNYKNDAHYLINLYDNKENNFIRTKAGRYLRYYEIKKFLLVLKQE